MNSEVFNAVGPAGWGTYELTGTGLRPAEGKASYTLAPGFVDLHIHGAFGLDLMSATADDLVGLAEELSLIGYDAFLPTTVTSSIEGVLSAIDQLPDHPMIPGFHLEGPFLSPAFPGAQPPEWIVDPPSVYSLWGRILEDPRLKRITLAPERPGAIELINWLFERGVQVSMGHSNATFDESLEAFKSGARHATHTFNAMRPFHHREAGIVGQVLVNPDIYAELIYDRLHVSKAAAKLLIQTRPMSHLVAVSDATLAAGLPNGEVTMWGHDCTVRDGSVRLVDGTLAGSAATLDQCFIRLWEDFGPEIAITACCHNPRRLLGLTETPNRWLRVDSLGRVVEIISC